MNNTLAMVAIFSTLSLSLFSADNSGQERSEISAKESGTQDHQDASLEFLADIPELKGVSLGMRETAFQNILTQRKLRSERSTTKDETSYYVYVPGKEREATVYFGFRDALCTGIQRLQPGPRK